MCLPRQYRTFSGIAYGRETHRFFAKLIAGGFATTDLSAPAHAGRLYHLQYKPWYRPLGATCPGSALTMDQARSCTATFTEIVCQRPPDCRASWWNAAAYDRPELGGNGDGTS